MVRLVYLEHHQSICLIIGIPMAHLFALLTEQSLRIQALRVCVVARLHQMFPIMHVRNRILSHMDCVHLNIRMEETVLAVLTVRAVIVQARSVHWIAPPAVDTVVVVVVVVMVTCATARAQISEPKIRIIIVIIVIIIMATMTVICGARVRVV